MEKVQNIETDNRKAWYGQQHPDFKIGGEVLLDTQNMKRGKLDKRKAGPFKISWVGKQACILQGILAGYYYILHVSLLQPYQRGTDAPPPIKLPPWENNQSQYTPEKIIACGEENKETLFLIEWKEYPSDKATWEPFKSL
jgi:hypothetical protein